MSIEPSNKRPLVSIGWAPSFSTDVKDLDENVGRAASIKILRDLSEALETLKRYEWDSTLIRQSGYLGLTYEYDFHPDYVFTFSAEDDVSDEYKRLLKVTYVLRRLFKK